MSDIIDENTESLKTIQDAKSTEKSSLSIESELESVLGEIAAAEDAEQVEIGEVLVSADLKAKEINPLPPIDKSEETLRPKNDGSKKRETNIPKKKQYKTYDKGAKNASLGEVVSPPRISEGELLEYRMKRLVFYMGYFPKLGVYLRTTQDESSDPITDLDVYGIYIHRDFSSKAIWADCKSGQAKAHDRIAWIKGIKDSIDVNDVIFVKSGVRHATKTYARKAGVQILDVRILDKLERDYGIRSNDWRGSWNYQVLQNKQRLFPKLTIPTNDIFKKINSFITGDYWVLDNFSKVKKSITALRDLSSYITMELSEEQISAVKWAVCELVGLFTLAVLNIAKEVYYFTEDEKREAIAEGLTSSEIPLKKRMEIVDATFRYAINLIKQQYPDVSLPVKGLNLTPPSYFEAFNDLVSRITNNPHDYYEVLRFLDFIMFEYDLQNKSFDEKEVLQLFSNVRGNISSAKTILHFVHQVTGIPRDMFGIIR